MTVVADGVEVGEDVAAVAEVVAVFVVAAVGDEDAVLAAVVVDAGVVEELVVVLEVVETVLGMVEVVAGVVVVVVDVVEGVVVVCWGTATSIPGTSPVAEGGALGSGMKMWVGALVEPNSSGGFGYIKTGCRPSEPTDSTMTKYGSPSPSEVAFDGLLEIILTVSPPGATPPGITRYG